MTTATTTPEETIVIPGQTTIDEQVAEQSAEQRKAERALANQAYNAAWGTLREKYRSEYDELLDKEFAARGLVRRRRATAAEAEARAEAERLAKARKAMAELLEKNPTLATEFGLAPA